MLRMIRSAGICLLVVASLAAVPLAQPERALADNATLSTCDESSLDAALATAELNGEGRSKLPVPVRSP
ncbi:MAG: hypothetical protein R2849_06100 [Thermomicrobiales bacterium]